jgi:hypothetical protein
MGTLLLTVFLAVGVQAQTQAAGPPPQTKEKSPEELAIERVQKVVVRTVDGSLPERTLQSWLKEVFGPTASIRWDLGDCGDQLGTPAVIEKQSRAVPTCVDASVSLNARRVLHLLFLVDVPKGSARPLPPTFAYGVVMEGENSTTMIKSLSEASRIR